MQAIPELGTQDLTASKAFWEAAGFTVTDYDNGFAFVGRDEVEFHLFQTEEQRSGGGLYLIVADVDAERERWATAGLTPSPVADEPWGMREFFVVDPGGNRVRVGTNL